MSMSTIEELKDADKFGDSLYDLDKECGAAFRKGLRNMGSPKSVYMVTLAGRNALKNDSWMTAHAWCLENVFQVHGKARGYAAVSKMGIYYFLKHEDALGFYLTFGDSFNG
jgi:hypothetical protein